MLKKIVLFNLLLLILTVAAYAQSANDSRDLGERALADYMEGRFVQAETSAEQAMDETPNSSIAYAVKALVLLRNRKYNEADGFLNRAESISKENILQGRESRSVNNPPKFYILLNWERYIQSLNDPLYSSEWNDEKKGYVRDGLRNLSPPVSAFDHFVKGLANIMLERDAETDLMKAVQLNPRFAVAYLRLGRVNIKNKNYDQSAVNFRKAIEINPNYSDAYNALGDSFYFKGNQDAAIENYTKAIQLDPKNETAYFNRGDSNRVKKQFDAALADFSKAIELYPNYSDAYNSRGVIYFYEKNQKELALADFNKAVETNQQNGYAFYNRGVYYNQKGDFGSARGNLEEAVKYNPTGSAYIELGYAYNRTGVFDKSLAVMNKAIELVTDNSFAYFQRGFANREMGNYEAAIADYTRAIELYPKDANAFYNRGLIHFNDVQKFQSAINDFSKAVELNPQNWDAYFYRANVYESMGNQSAADADRKKLKDLKDIALKDPKRFIRTLYPNATFDPVLAKNALAEGSSTIAGQACAYSGGKFNARYVKIFLYPVTPYFDSWYKLREKQEDKLTAVYLSKEAARYRLETQANDEGKFVFKNLKPGKYFIQTIFEYSYSGTSRVYAGSDTTYNGPVATTTNYYYDQDYIVNKNARLETFVEVKSDGEIVKTDMAKGGGILRRGC